MCNRLWTFELGENQYLFTVFVTWKCSLRKETQLKAAFPCMGQNDFFGEKVKKLSKEWILHLCIRPKRGVGVAMSCLEPCGRGHLINTSDNTAKTNTPPYRTNLPSDKPSIWTPTTPQSHSNSFFVYAFQRFSKLVVHCSQVSSWLYFIDVFIYHT